MESLDTNIEEKKSAPFKSATVAFVISFGVLIFLFVLRFISRYSEDIFGKNFQLSTIANLISLVAMTLINFTLPVCIILFSVFYYKEKFQSNNIDIIREIRKSLLPVFGVFIGLFLWTAYINPSINLRMNALLYDMRNAKSGEELQRTNLQLFRDNYSFCNFNHLVELYDSIENKQISAKTDAAGWITTMIDSSHLDIVLNSMSAHELNLTRADFKNQTWRNNNNINDEIPLDKINIFLRNAKDDLNRYETRLTNILIEKYRMIGFPVLMILIFYLGMFIGILRRNGRFIPILILAIYFIFYPFITFLILLSQRMPRAEMISPGWVQFYILLFVMIINYLFFLLARRNLSRKIELTSNSL